MIWTPGFQIQSKTFSSTCVYNNDFFLDSKWETEKSYQFFSTIPGFWDDIKLYSVYDT